MKELENKKIKLNRVRLGVLGDSWMGIILLFVLFCLYALRGFYLDPTLNKQINQQFQSPLTVEPFKSWKNEKVRVLENQELILPWNPKN